MVQGEELVFCQFRLEKSPVSQFSIIEPIFTGKRA